MPNEFRLGLVINPVAGIGGPAAFKGSDDPVLRARGYAGELPLAAPQRACTFLQCLIPMIPPGVRLTVVTVPGLMGAQALEELQLPVELTGYLPQDPSGPADTQAAVRAIVGQRVDLLAFVGGDGTARDVCAELGETQPVLGVPAGVKMHSGVYAINPQSAAQLVAQLMTGTLINLLSREVRDIDEEAFRRGVVRSRPYGSMRVPEEDRLVQQVKQGGQIPEELILVDMADHLQEVLEPHTLIIVGPGSTTWHIARHWGLEATLLGVDLVCDGRLLAADVDAATVLRQVQSHPGPAAIVVTAIGGQGHILGRGNQQISVAILRQLGRDALHVVATRSKLEALDGRPLVMDSGSLELDREWGGYIPVISGYHDVLLYPLGETPCEQS